MGANLENNPHLSLSRHHQNYQFQTKFKFSSLTPTDPDIPQRLLASWCLWCNQRLLNRTPCTYQLVGTQAQFCAAGWLLHAVELCVQCMLTSNWYLYVQIWHRGGSLYTHHSPSFSQAIAILGGAFWRVGLGVRGGRCLFFLTMRCFNDAMFSNS